MSLETEKILGLTLHAPWGELAADGWKTIENRGWPPPPWMLGRYLAIHQSTRWDQEGFDFVARNHSRFRVEPPRWQQCKYGIIAVAQLVGWVQRPADAVGDQEPKVIAMLDGHAFGGDDWRWFHGAHFGWVLRDVRRIAPVACRGLQKLWKLPPLAYESVKRRWSVTAGGAPAAATTR